MEANLVLFARGTNKFDWTAGERSFVLRISAANFKGSMVFLSTTLLFLTVISLL
jgi:hypothetical protein